MKLSKLIFILGSSFLLAACSATIQDEMAEDQTARPYMQNTSIDNVNTDASPYQYMHQTKEEATQPVTNVAQPNTSAPPTLKTKRPKISQIQTTTTESTTVTDTNIVQNQEIPVTNVLSDWKPNEAQLIRGHELIAGLQRDIGGKPNMLEMQQRIKTHMGLSEVQSQQLIMALGQ